MADGFADSAGRPWAGRQFEPVPYADDDGTAPPALASALDAFAAGASTADAVVAALRGTRLLVPLLAQLGEAGVGAHGRTVDKSADLAVVTVRAADGRTVLPAFTSVAAMQRWNPVARPVPTPAERVALAAASDADGILVLDPGSPTEFVLR
ncbi:MAG TPA: SseB family protein, partial [Naasia sp.]